MTTPLTTWLVVGLTLLSHTLYVFFRRRSIDDTWMLSGALGGIIVLIVYCVYDATVLQNKF